MSTLWDHALSLSLRTATLFADATTPDVASLTGSSVDFWGERLFHGVVLAVVYGVIGILLVALGFKVFDWITPKLDIEKELAEKQNIAVAILCSAVIIGVCIIVAIAVR